MQRFLVRLVLAAVVTIGPVAVLLAHDNAGTTRRAMRADATPLEDIKVHINGDAWMTVLNDGSFGSHHSNPELPPSQWTHGRPSFEFPGDSRLDYLYKGGL